MRVHTGWVGVVVTAADDDAVMVKLTIKHHNISMFNFPHEPLIEKDFSILDHDDQSNILNFDQERKSMVHEHSEVEGEVIPIPIANLIESIKNKLYVILSFILLLALIIMLLNVAKLINYFKALSGDTNKTDHT